MKRSSVITDMTKGNETRLLINFMMPMLIGNIFQQVYNIADSIIVGQFEGANSLGAIGCTGAITFLFFSICHGLTSGAGIMVSQYFGAGNDENVKKTITNSFYVISLIGILLSIAGVVLTEPILVALDTPQAQLPEAISYMKIVCAGTIAVSIYNFAANVMRALGDAATPLKALLAATVLNIVLDLLFVVKFGWGVDGAAYATIIAQSISAIGSLIVAFIKNPYFKFQRNHFTVDRAITGLCFKVGLPLGMQGFTIAVSCIILQKFVNSFDAAVVTAFTVTNRVEQIVQQPFASLSTAISTFTAQNIGAGKTERARRGLIQAVKLVFVFSLVMFAVCFSFGNLIIRCFVQDTAVIAIGTRGLTILSTMFFPLGIIYVTRGLLNGANDSFYAMINGFIEVSGRVIFSLILVYLIPIGIWSVWFATGFTWILTAVAGTIRYKQGLWVRRSIVKPCQCS